MMTANNSKDNKVMYGLAAGIWAHALCGSSRVPTGIERRCTWASGVPQEGSSPQKRERLLGELWGMMGQDSCQQSRLGFGGALKDHEG